MEGADLITGFDPGRGAGAIRRTRFSKIENIEITSYYRNYLVWWNFSRLKRA
jgi:hypothetical protein